MSGAVMVVVSGRGMAVATFRKAAFSSCKDPFVAMTEANYR